MSQIKFCLLRLLSLVTTLNYLNIIMGRAICWQSLIMYSLPNSYENKLTQYLNHNTCIFCSNSSVSVGREMLNPLI